MSARTDPNYQTCLEMANEFLFCRMVSSSVYLRAGRSRPGTVLSDLAMVGISALSLYTFGCSCNISLLLGKYAQYFYQSPTTTSLSNLSTGAIGTIQCDVSDSDECDGKIIEPSSLACFDFGLWRGCVWKYDLLVGKGDLAISRTDR